METSSLLRPDATSKSNAALSPKRLVYGIIGFVACGFIIAGAFFGENLMQWHEANMDLSETPLPGAPRNDIDSYGWYFYKAAFPTKNGSTDAVLRFMSNYTGGYNCEKVPLGCDGWKITCNYGTSTYEHGSWDRVLHYVHAPRFFSHALEHDSLGVDGWQDLTVQSMEGMNSFSAFMHNKVQLFILNVAEKASTLELNGYDVLRRLSYWKDGKTVLAHASTQISGKVWEFIGFAPADVTDWNFWSEEECPAAHRVDAEAYKLQQNLEKLREGDDDREMLNTSFWISIGVAASSENYRQEMLASLQNLTGAHISYDKSSSCEVATISYKNYDTLSEDSMGDETTMKIVINRAYQSVSLGGKEYSIKMYEDYIYEVHRKYLQKPHGSLRKDRWRNWDHWLDQHVGLKWKEEYGCYDHSRAVTSYLLDANIPVGKRAIQQDGDHYYSGYSGSSMCIEYNTESCHYGIGETDVCGCNRENSNLVEDLIGSDTLCDTYDDLF